MSKIVISYIHTDLQTNPITPSYRFSPNVVTHTFSLLLIVTFSGNHRLHRKHGCKQKHPTAAADDVFKAACCKEGKRQMKNLCEQSDSGCANTPTNTHGALRLPASFQECDLYCETTPHSSSLCQIAIFCGGILQHFCTGHSVYQAPFITLPLKSHTKRDRDRVGG